MTHIALSSPAEPSSMLMPRESIPHKDSSANNTVKQKSKGAFERKKNHRSRKLRAGIDDSSKKTSTLLPSEHAVANSTSTSELPRAVVVTSASPVVTKQKTGATRPPTSEKLPSQEARSRKWRAMLLKSRETRVEEREGGTNGEKSSKGPRTQRSRHVNQPKSTSKKQENKLHGTTWSVARNSSLLNQNDIPGRVRSVSAPSTDIATPKVRISSNQDKILISRALSLSPTHEPEPGWTEKNEYQTNAAAVCQQIHTDSVVLCLQPPIVLGAKHPQNNNRQRRFEEADEDFRKALDVGQGGGEQDKGAVEADFAAKTRLASTLEEKAKSPLKRDECNAFLDGRIGEPFLAGNVASPSAQLVNKDEISSGVKNNSVESTNACSPGSLSSSDVLIMETGARNSLVCLRPQVPYVQSPPPPLLGAPTGTMRVPRGSRKLRAEAAEFHPNGLQCSSPGSLETESLENNSTSNVLFGLGKGGGPLVQFSATTWHRQGSHPTRPPQSQTLSPNAQSNHLTKTNPTSEPKPNSAGTVPFAPPASAPANSPSPCQDNSEPQQTSIDSASQKSNEASQSLEATLTLSVTRLLAGEGSLQSYKWTEFPSIPQNFSNPTLPRFSHAKQQVSIRTQRDGVGAQCRVTSDVSSPVMRPPSAPRNFSLTSFASTGNMNSPQLLHYVVHSPLQRTSAEGAGSTPSKTDGNFHNGTVRLASSPNKLFSQLDSSPSSPCQRISAREERDTVRLTHLAVADDVAQNEELMYGLLADADASAEDMEDEILYIRETHGNRLGGVNHPYQYNTPSNADFDTRSTTSTHSHVRHESRLGGYWSLNGPRVMEATRLYPPLRHGRNTTTDALNIPPSHPGGGGSAGIGNAASTQLPGRTPSVGTMDYDDYRDTWEVDSSPYEDSLDEEQIQWIEEQLRSNQTAKIFF